MHTSPVRRARLPPRRALWLTPPSVRPRLVAVGATEDVHFMLDQGHAGVNQVDRWGRSAMHFAAARGDIAMIQVGYPHGCLHSCLSTSVLRGLSHAVPRPGVVAARW